MVEVKLFWIMKSKASSSIPGVYRQRQTKCVFWISPFGLFETFGTSRKTVEPSLSIRIYNKGNENSLVMATKVSWRMRNGRFVSGGTIGQLIGKYQGLAIGHTDKATAAIC